MRSVIIGDGDAGTTVGSTAALKLANGERETVMEKLAAHLEPSAGPDICLTVTVSTPDVSGGYVWRIGGHV